MAIPVSQVRTEARAPGQDPTTEDTIMSETTLERPARGPLNGVDTPTLWWSAACSKS